MAATKSFITQMVAGARTVRTFALAVAFQAAVHAGPAGAQSRADRGAPSGRGSIGLHLQVSEPKGEFGQNTGNGFGAGGYVLVRLDPNSIANLRGDFSFLTYGSSTRRIPLSGTGGLIQLDLRTTSNIVSIVAGPQLLGPTGTFTPYATALGGFSVFWTSSSIEGSNNENDAFATTTNASDAAWAGLEASSLHSHMRHEMTSQLYVRLTTNNWDEAMAARAEGPANVRISHCEAGIATIASATPATPGTAV